MKKISACLLKIIFCLYLLTEMSAVFADENAIGQAIWVKGNVQAITTDKVSRSLQRRSPVYVKDTIITDATGTGQLTFTDGTMLSLRTNTNIALSNYQHGAMTPPDEDSFAVTVIKGGFRTVTGIISKNNPQGYQVSTPLGTIGVHGTIYDLFYNAMTTKLSVSITEGQITIKAPSHAPVVLTQGTQNIAAVVSAKGIEVTNIRPTDLKSIPTMIPAVSAKPVSPQETPRGTPGKNQIQVSPCP